MEQWITAVNKVCGRNVGVTGELVEYTLLGEALIVVHCVLPCLDMPGFQGASLVELCIHHFCIIPLDDVTFINCMFCHC